MRARPHPEIVLGATSRRGTSTRRRPSHRALPAKGHRGDGGAVSSGRRHHLPPTPTWPRAAGHEHDGGRRRLMAEYALTGPSRTNGALTIPANTTGTGDLDPVAASTASGRDAGHRPHTRSPCCSTSLSPSSRAALATRGAWRPALSPFFRPRSGARAASRARAARRCADRTSVLDELDRLDAPEQLGNGHLGLETGQRRNPGSGGSRNRTRWWWGPGRGRRPRGRERHGRGWRPMRMITNSPARSASPTVIGSRSSPGALDGET